MIPLSPEQYGSESDGGDSASHSVCRPAGCSDSAECVQKHTRYLQGWGGETEGRGREGERERDRVFHKVREFLHIVPILGENGQAWPYVCVCGGVCVLCEFW